jgi:SAM-dependent methyltransferase
MLKDTSKTSVPPLFALGKKVLLRFLGPSGTSPFRSSLEYWEERYKAGGNSGAGSYGRLSLFKASVLNAFVAEHQVRTVVEFGSGDGAQLSLAAYPHYLGVDVSHRALAICREKFRGDRTKRFVHVTDYARQPETAELALSLDVIYHLVEDAIYEEYMLRLVNAAERFICLYSSDFDGPGPATHVRHRHVTRWMSENAHRWRMLHHIPNIYRPDPARPNDTSWSDFFIFERNPQT